MFSKEDLNRFTGTERYHQHGLSKRVAYTDGCAYLVEHGAAWLVDAIASHLTHDPKLVAAMAKNEELKAFHVWTLTLGGKGGAVLECRADTGTPVMCRQEIPYTDCPFDMKLFAAFTRWISPQGQPVEGHVLMLPSEY